MSIISVFPGHKNGPRLGYCNQRTSLIIVETISCLALDGSQQWLIQRSASNCLPTQAIGVSCLKGFPSVKHNLISTFANPPTQGIILLVLDFINSAEALSIVVAINLRSAAVEACN